MASGDQAGACDGAARLAARESGVPLDLMLAITRVETGRGSPAAPWPWTVNSLGKGYWFPSLQTAIDFAEAEMAAGRTSFDVGCFQMNLRWHGNRFSSIGDMFDPARNAHESARFLRELYDRTGNWTRAAAAYHSLTPERGTDYLRRILAVLDDPSPADTEVPVAVRTNRFPLLQRGAVVGLGSLVPAMDAQRSPLFGED